MINKPAKLAVLLLGLWAILGVLGCSGDSSPVIPGAGDVLASAGTDVDSTSGTDVDVTSETSRTADDGTFTGILEDSEGNPLAWADLYLDGEIAGWTEEDGSFTIYGVDEEKEYQLEAEIDRYVVYSTTVVPASRNGQGLGDNDPTIERGTVWGFVHDQIGPVQHALVIVFNASENFGIDFTDENGYYIIDNAPGGPGHVIAFAPFHAIGHDKVFVIPGGEVQKNLYLPKLLDFGIVKGQVITGPLGHMRPIPFAAVGIKPANTDVEPKITHANRHGIYILAPVGLGPHMMFAKAPCFPAETAFVNVHPGINYQMFHLEAQGCGGVEGQVTNENGEPLPFVLVKLIHPLPDNDKPFMMWEFTGPEGRYRFAPVIPSLGYHLQAQAPGYLPYNHDGPVPVFPDQFTVIDFTMICADGSGDCPPPPPPPPPGGGGPGGGDG